MLTVDTRVLAEKFMPKTDPSSLGGRLIRGSVFDVVYFYYSESDDNKCVKTVFTLLPCLYYQ